MSAPRTGRGARSALRMVPEPPDSEPIQLALNLFGPDPDDIRGFWWITDDGKPVFVPAPWLNPPDEERSP